jgi:predicted GH43/DUF377 family glycosyl hydrolase
MVHHDADGGPSAPADASEGRLTEDADLGNPPREQTDLGAAGCYDFVDGDEDRFADCEDPDCESSAFCCVGSSHPGCCEERPSSEVSFASCAPASSCPGVHTFFGLPGPRVFDDALIPYGGERFDGGAVLAGEVDPRVTRLTLRGIIRAGDPCDSGCIDAVGFGLTSTQTTFDTTTRVAADVALVVSASLQEVRLLVGGSVVAAASFLEISEALGDRPDDSPVTEPLEYVLETTPDGVVQARVGSFDVATDARFVPAGPARVVIFGRTSNRGGGDETAGRIRSLRVTEHLCDVPSAVARSAAPILPDDIDPWWSSAQRVTSPSTVVYRAEDSRREYMVYVYQGRIHLAQGLGDGRFRAIDDPRQAANALIRAQGEEWLAGGVADPELVQEGNRWVIYFTAIARDGSRSIGRAIGDRDLVFQFRNVEQVRPLVPGADTLGYDQPDVYVAQFGEDQRTLLAVRRITERETSIEIYEMSESSLALADTVVPDAARSSLTRARAVVAPRGGIAFDADEVAAPALVQYRGVLRLYYAGRRGTRWAIGAMLSEDGVHWRAANDGAPLLSGSGTGFDALSVSDPDPVIVDGELRLYYTGSDGVSAAIGLGRHAIP